MRRIHSSRRWVAAVVAVAGSACTPSPDQARYTVDEYRADAKLRRAQFDRCANDPGTLGDTPDCINVRQAARLEDTRSLRDLPPVQLPRLTPRRSGSTTSDSDTEERARRSSQGENAVAGDDKSRAEETR